MNKCLYAREHKFTNSEYCDYGCGEKISISLVQDLINKTEKLEYELYAYKTMYEELKKENEIMRETLIIIYNNTEPSTFYRYDALQNSHDLIELAIPKEWK